MQKNKKISMLALAMKITERENEKEAEKLRKLNNSKMYKKIKASRERITITKENDRLVYKIPSELKSNGLSTFKENNIDLIQNFKNSNLQTITI